MPDLALGLAAALACGLAAAGLAGAIRPRLGYAVALALCAAGALAVLAYLAAGAAPARITVPFGLPGAGMTLALDGLSGFFLLLVFLVGAATSAAGLAAPLGAASVPPLLGALALTLLAGDGFSLVLGFGATATAAFALILAGAEPAARRQLGIAAVALFCLVPALALLAPAGGAFGFAAIRAHPPEGWRAVLLLLLALLGAGSQAGLVPLHLWLPASVAAAPAPGAAVLAGAVPGVALYALIRLLFDLAGPAQPAWWGAPLIALGAAGAVLGGLRATQEADFKSVLGSAVIGQSGLIAVGLGVALAARATDLPPVAALALGGALLQAMAVALAATLLVLAAGAVQAGAGTQHLARLGGLIRGMRRTTLTVLVGAAALAALPPGGGFPGVWMLFQAVFAAPRIGGLPMQALLVAAAACMALAVALAATAAVRLIGVAFLGRPRTPRAAAAQEPPAAMRHAMLALAGASLLLGLFPATVLALAQPALLLAVGAGLGGRSGALAVAAQADAPGYAAPALALLLALALALGWLLARSHGPGGHRTAPAWDGGADAPPPWLPFGDPLTQVGAAGFAQTLRAPLGRTLLGARETVDPAPPGAADPARLFASARDPATAFLVRPALRLHRRIAERAARVQRRSVRGALALVLATLVLLLLAAAWP